MEHKYEFFFEEMEKKALVEEILRKGYKAVKYNKMAKVHEWPRHTLRRALKTSFKNIDSTIAARGKKGSDIGEKVVGKIPILGKTNFIKNIGRSSGKAIATSPEIGFTAAIPFPGALETAALTVNKINKHMSKGLDKFLIPKKVIGKKKINLKELSKQ